MPGEAMIFFCATWGNMIILRVYLSVHLRSKRVDQVYRSLPGVSWGRVRNIVRKDLYMKYKWSFKLAVAVDYFLHFVGATAFLIAVLTLLVGRLDFWIGAACTIPGVVIVELLDNYILREGDKQMLAMADKALKEREDPNCEEESK